MLTFRAAAIDDIATILELALSGAVTETGDDPARADDPRYIAAFTAIVEDPNHILAIAERDGVAVGTIHITFLPGITRFGMWRGLLENVFIHPDQRGQGLGSEMISWAISRCRERGCGMVQLTSNKKRLDAHRFYERLGFEKSHEGFKLFL